MAAQSPDIEDVGRECTCAECAALCATVPGRMTLGDAKRLQAHLGGPGELVKHTAFEVFDLSTPCAVLRPRVQGERAEGGFCGVFSKCGPCVFLDEDTGCTLTAATGKPAGCRGAYGCVPAPDDSNDPLNEGILASWRSPEADAFLEELDAYRAPGPPHKEALRAHAAATKLFDNPYGLLALEACTVRIQATALAEGRRRAQMWDGAHPSAMTLDTHTSLELQDALRKNTYRHMKDARAAFRAAISGADRQLVESGRKRARLHILDALKDIDDIMYGAGAIAEDGDFLYVMRSWIETLTRP